MLYTDFIRHFEKLSEMWPNFYNDARKKMLWKTAEQCNSYTFGGVVEDFIKSGRSAPTPEDIEKKLSKRHPPAPPTEDVCQLCEGHHWVLHWEDNNVATRCNCVGGPSALLTGGKNPRLDADLRAIIASGLHDKIIRKRTEWLEINIGDAITPPEEAQALMNVVYRRMAGLISDEDWEAHKQVCVNMARTRRTQSNHP